MGLRITCKSDFTQSVWRPFFGLLQNLGPLRRVAVAELGVQPIENLFGGIFDSDSEHNERLFLATGKEKAGSLNNLVDELLDALFLAVVLRYHRLTALLALMCGWNAFEVERFLGGLS